MNIEPKPAAGEVCGFTGNTIPTGEWTVGRIGDLIEADSGKWNLLAKAINAALAAAYDESESHGALPYKELEDLYRHALKDLAAARSAINGQKIAQAALAKVGKMSTEPKPATGEWTAEALARQFHELYESYACEFAYETRQETRAFDPTTPNGRLMIAVCKAIADAHNAALAKVGK